MRKFALKKLIRDKVFTDMEKLGQKLDYRILSEVELRAALKAKLLEEAQEFEPDKPGGLDELADILEAVETAATALGADFDTLRAVQASRQEKRGGFEKRIYINTVELEDTDPWVEYYAARPEKFPEV